MKKILSLFLAIIIIGTGVLPCIAASEKCTCGEPPIIYVAALGSAGIYANKGTANEKKLFRPETDALLSDFAPLVPAALDLFSTSNYDKFGDVLISCVNKGFGDLALDADGNSKSYVTADESHPERANHTLDDSFYFGYDFRIDPVENAKKLYTYIQEVKALTKHDTVRFRASSMGGVVTLAYIKLYGTKDIETIILQNCPLLGTAVAGELFNGKVYIDKDALVKYADGALPALDSDALGGILHVLIEMLDKGGVFLGLVDIADKLVHELKDRVYDESLIPVFATMPGIWSFVPHEYYETAKSYMKLSKEDNSVLLNKLDYYHYEVQQNAGKLLRSAQNDGTNVYIVAGYNMQRTPLVEAYKSNSDGTVDTCYASVGATCANLGEILPESYVQKNFADTKYISNDRVIDASTCALPEVTWFIKDMLHSTTHSGHHAFYRRLFNSDEQLTVHTMPGFPQFLQNDTVNEDFYCVTKTGTPLEEAFKMASMQTSFLNIMKLLTAFFDEILDILIIQPLN